MAAHLGLFTMNIHFTILFIKSDNISETKSDKATQCLRSLVINIRPIAGFILRTMRHRHVFWRLHFHQAGTPYAQIRMPHRLQYTGRLVGSPLNK